MNENYFGFKDTPEDRMQDDTSAMIAETGSSDSLHREKPRNRNKTKLNEMFILQNLTMKIKRE